VRRVYPEGYSRGTLRLQYGARTAERSALGIGQPSAAGRGLVAGRRGGPGGCGTERASELTEKEDGCVRTCHNAVLARYSLGAA